MALLLIALLLVIIPILTYYASRALFYQNANNKALGKRPPTIPYLVPGIFHTFSLAYEGPQKCFATLINKFGQHAPFTVKSGLLSFVVLQDPKHIETVAQASKQQSPHALYIRMYAEALGYPKAALDLYAIEGVGGKEKEAFQYAHTTLSQKYLTGASLASISDVYVSMLSRSLNDKMFQIGSWTQIEDFWSFFQQVITRCTMETLFGSAISKQYRGLIKDYWMFDDAIESFMPGMPRLFTSASYQGPRDRLHEGIEKWLKTNHSGSEFAKIADEDPIWDEHKGLKFIQERDDVFAKIEGKDWKTRTAEVLSVMRCSNSTLVPSTFWMIVETLRKPHLAKYLTTEISQYHSPKAATYDVNSFVNKPIFQSIHTEIGRLRMATYMIRNNTVDDIPLDEHWTLPKGTSAIAFSQDIATNTELWAKARPRTVERPLEEFWAERFLIPDKQLSKPQREKHNNFKVEAGKFSIDGLEALDLAIGDQQYSGLGREYIKAIQASTLAVLLSEFELQLCDPEATDAAMPTLGETAFGTVRSLDKIAVRIRKRRPDEE
ncbi:cytochrome P450 [Clathrospora elynae]|uniref:Cytochrome P450 n=1 Tax=Clathrospora elynae TaxID=706981 RepID=A0A6A5SZ82_9PLEO|nr:cytochrome P450 [Clathrospora elynae]